jgi:glucokinase
VIVTGKYTIGIDLGGTNIRAGAVDAAGQLVHRCSIETQAEHGFEHVFARLVQLVDDVIAGANLTKADVAAIGYGTPGPMSHEKGIVYASPNLPGWINIPLRARFTEATGLPVTLDNDANVAAYGEFVAGAGKGTQDMAMLTLGTGVGGGIVIGGQLQRGAFDTAAEIGHTIVVPNGRPCPCGQQGCFERYASANSVPERFVEALQAGAASPLKARVDAGATLTSVDIATAARNGDALAARVWDETCLFLAIACVNLQHLLNPQCVVLGGGLIGAGQQLLGPTREHFEQQSWKLAEDHPRIEFATLGDDAGIIGAAALARIDHGMA